MSSKLFDEAQVEFQNELIKYISEKNTSPRIRFHKLKEGILSDEEEHKIASQYKIYNIFVYVTNHSKKSKKTEFKVKVGRNFGLELFGSGLDYPIESHLRSWGRSAASILVSYFKEHYEVYIGVLRFDLLTQDKETFIIPDLRLESNIFLYNSIADSNRAQILYDSCLRSEMDFNDTNCIPFEKIVQDRMDDKLQMEQFRSQLEALKNKNET